MVAAIPRKPRNIAREFELEIFGFPACGPGGSLRSSGRFGGAPVRLAAVVLVADDRGHCA